jgi:hypothetical protein
MYGLSMRKPGAGALLARRKKPALHTLTTLSRINRKRLRLCMACALYPSTMAAVYPVGYVIYLVMLPACVPRHPAPSDETHQPGSQQHQTYWLWHRSGLRKDLPVRNGWWRIL